MTPLENENPQGHVGTSSTIIPLTNIEREATLRDDLFRFELSPGIDPVEPLLQP